MSDSRRSPAAAATIERWRLPEVEGPIIGRPREERARTAEAEESLRLTLKEAEARGYEAGMSRARTEMSAQDRAKNRLFGVDICRQASVEGMDVGQSGHTLKCRAIHGWSAVVNRNRDVWESERQPCWGAS